MAAVPRVVKVLTALVVGVIVVGIMLVLLDANDDNPIVGAILDLAGFLGGPFEEFFELDDDDEQLAVNWAIAAAVYGVLGLLLNRALAAATTRATATAERRRREQRVSHREEAATREERAVADDEHPTRGGAAPEGRGRRMPWRRRS